MNPTFYLCAGYLLYALTHYFLANKQRKSEKIEIPDVQAELRPVYSAINELDERVSALEEPMTDKTPLCALSLDKAIEHLEAGLKGPVTDKTPHKQTTGKLLREFRRTNRISQREVAKKSGISPSSLSRLECDYKKITKQQAKKLADVFNVPYKDLMKK